MNHFQLVARIIEREVLRYTPAGIPVVSAKLAHSSEQMEQKVLRLVEFEISAIAIGEISGRFNQLELGQPYQFTGFMTRKNQRSKSLVFHLTAIDENKLTHVVKNI